MMNIFVDHLNKMAVPRICPGGDWNWYNQSLFLVLPLYHDFGFSLLHICLLTGMTIILAKKFDPHVFLSSIERYRVEIFFCVPPTVLFLTKHPDLHKYNLSSLRIVMCGGAVLGKELAEEFSQIYKNAILCQGYGLTECSVLSHLPRFVREDGYESAGFPLATYEMKIVDPDTHAEMPNGSKGEIWLRAPTVMLGYLNRPEATAEMIDKDGWMKTGDIGYIDATGQTRILERIKEVIKVNGRQVSPSELEDVLMAQPEILDAAVIGIPDPKYGEIPKAFIIRSNEKLTKRDVEKLIEERFAVYKWLKGGVEFVSVIPKSPSGKILRRFLRRYKEAMFRCDSSVTGLYFSMSPQNVKDCDLCSNSSSSSIDDVIIRKANLKDFDELLEILIKFYTKYERVSVHVGVTDEDVREMVKGRLKTTLTKGICAVAEIDGKIEGVISGIMFNRYEPYAPDFHHLSDRVFAIEGLCETLTANLWNQVPPKFNTVCQLTYGLVSPKAQGFSVGKKLLKLAAQLCLEKGVRVLMSECLVDKTARWVNSQGFVVVNTLPLDQWKNKKGRPYFEGLPDKMAVLLLAFLDNTVEFTKSRL